MDFFKAENPDGCAKVLAEKIDGSLKQGEKVLWLLSGGSNIPISVVAMNILRTRNTDGVLSNLAVTLTDERYGPVGHKDSNWQQLVDAGFIFTKTKLLPVLKNLSLEKTVMDYDNGITDLFQWADKSIGQFGIGNDGHIAGVLPHTSGVFDPGVAVSYEAPPFTRITLTLKTIQKISAVYAFVFGQSKKATLSHLQGENLSLNEEPSTVLKLLPEAYLYSDQLI